jgi:hypothetical protein
MRRRLALLGVTGVVLIAMTAGALRIYQLEQRVASLEVAARSQVKGADITVATVRGPLDVTYTPVVTDQPAIQSPGRAMFPDGATRHEINGMTYYIMPLAANSANANGVTIQR